MAPVMSLCRASCRPGQSVLGGSSARSNQQRQQRVVAAHATADDQKCNAAIASLSAAALLVSSGAVDPAAAAALAPSPASTNVAATSQLATTTKMVPGTPAPQVLATTGDAMSRSSSGPEANMDDPDAYFDSLDRMNGAAPRAPAASWKPIKYVEADAPMQVLSELADLNADVRDAASDYRDPAIATPQDKVSDALSGSGGPSLPGSADLSSAGDKLSGAADAAKSKASNMFSSALPGSSTPLAEVGDLNADVRDLSKGYRDPAGAIQQDKAAGAVRDATKGGNPAQGLGSKAERAKSKAKSLFGSGSSSALPVAPVGELADLNADVRDAASDYRDPAIATPQDKVSDALSGSGGPSLPGSADLSSASDKLSGAADAAKSKASNLFSSALPRAPLAEVGDLNADVRDLSKNYRDPAGAIQQDKAADAVRDATQGSGPSLPGSADLSSAGDKLSDAADTAKSKAKSLFGSGSRSALPRAPIGELADLNADVRDTASDYRDPAIATPQDKVSDTLSGFGGPSLPGSADLSSAGDKLSGAADAAKSKASNLFSSALPKAPLAEVGDLNADVRDLSKNYRDPAGAIQQDKAADAVRDVTQGSGPSLPGSADLSSAGDKLSDAADTAKSKAKSLFGSGSRSALPRAPVGELADLNADVRDAASDYRDPAIATPQDKVSDALSGSGGPSLPGSADLSSAGDKLSGAADAAKSKASNMFSSALPGSSTPLAEVGDLNADVRDLSKGYRDPAGAIQQDKAADAVRDATQGSGPSLPGSADLSSAGDKLSDAADSAKAKAKSLFGSGSRSALPRAPVGELADLNADVRDLSNNYRDPAGAIQQDKAADAVRDATQGSGPSLPGSADLSSAGDKLSDAADSAKAKAKSVFGSGSRSALPRAPVGELADLNADVRDLSKNYRDPAGAIQQDKAADAVRDATQGSGPSLPGSADLSSAGDKLSDAADSAKAKAKSLFGSGSRSALPRAPVGELADLNADVRDLSKNYRDPAGAIQQDKAADAVRDATQGSGPSLPGSADLSSAGDKLSDAAGTAKSKAKSLFGSGSRSALPRAPVGELADLNADVRDLSNNYRDPAGAIQQDKAAGAVRDATQGSGPSLPGSADLSSAGDKLSDAADAAKSKAKSVFGSGSSSALPRTPAGEVADLNSDVRGAASDYRDPAGVVQQDTAAGAVKEAGRGGNSLAAAKGKAKMTSDSITSSAKRVAKKAQVNVTSGAKRDIGVGAGYGEKGSTVNDAAGIKRLADDLTGSTAKPIGNARLSRPLVRDSLGVKRPGSKNQTGSAGGRDTGALDLAKDVVDRV